MKFQAALQGVDLNKKSENKKQQNMMFQHPDNFKDLSEEEKQKEAEKQIAAHKAMMSQQLRI